MKVLFIVSSVLIALLVVAAMGSAQAADQTVVFQVPVNLQNLHPDVKKASVHCKIMDSTSTNLKENYVELSIPARSYVGTVSVPVTLTQFQADKAEEWWCFLALIHEGLALYPEQGSGPAVAQAKPGTPFVKQIHGKILKSPRELAPMIPVPSRPDRPILIR